MDRTSKQSNKPRRFYFCEANKLANERPVIQHVCIGVGSYATPALITVCGRTRFGDVQPHHATDTVSQIECHDCRGWIDRYTY